MVQVAPQYMQGTDPGVLPDFCYLDSSIIDTKVSYLCMHVIILLLLTKYT